MSQKNIYLVRHPETFWNVEGRFQGSSESDITPKGKEYTHTFVQKLELPKIDIIYHANNNRTKYMAQKIKERYPKAKLICDIRLNERNCGDYEGRLYSDIYSEADSIKNYRKRFLWKPPNGESHEELSIRTAAFLKDLKDKLNDKVAICITSSGVIKNILRLERKLTLKEMYELKIPNLTLMRL